MGGKGRYVNSPPLCASGHPILWMPQATNYVYFITFFAVRQSGNFANALDDPLRHQNIGLAKAISIRHQTD